MTKHNSALGRLAMAGGLLGGLLGLQAAQPDGQWDFDTGNLDATVGANLTYLNAATSAGTAFGTTTSFGIPDIDGQPAQVMKIHAGSGAFEGYRLPVPNISNGGGEAELLNNYTLIFDLLYPAASDQTPRALLEADLGFIVTSEGAELFIGDNNGVGSKDSFDGTVNPDTWYRVGIVVDGEDGVIRKYLNGQLVGTEIGVVLDDRYALDSQFDNEAYLFHDSFGETALGYVNSIQFRATALETADMIAYGGPAATGIPLEIPAIPSFVDQWIPVAPFANTTAEIGVLLNPGDSTLSNIAFTLNGAAQTVSTETVDGLLRVTVDSPVLTASTDYTLAVTYTDNVAGEKSFSTSVRAVLLFEDFNDLTLLPKVDEGSDVRADAAYTHEPPTGWEVTRDGVPGWPDPAQDGITEWAGWSFAHRDFWNAADGQRRSEFTKGTGILAIADPDEWDDAAHAPGTFNTDLITLPIDVSSVAPFSLFVRFDSSWRPEDDQKARLTVSFDDGPETTLFTWVSDSASPDFKNDDSTNDTITRALNNPEGASTMKITWTMFDAGNDWWWAVDNIVVDSGDVPPSFTQQPQFAAVGPGESVTFSANAVGTEPIAYQWFKGAGESRQEIPGATGRDHTIAAALATDAGLYSVDIENPAGSETSGNARLLILPDHTGTGLIAGQWDFTAGNLAATTGNDLFYFDNAGGATEAATEFGTTADFSLPAIGGQQADVMKFAAAMGDMGYVAIVGGANGDAAATKKNQYTLIYDILFPAETDGEWRTFVQLDTLNNSTDGELFVNPANGIGISGQYEGAIVADAWHRVAFVVDQTEGRNEIRKFIDGQLVGFQSAGGLDGRFGLGAAINLFADDGGDANIGFVSSIQVRNEAMTDLQVLAMGAATADGIPATIDASLLAPVISVQPETGFYLSPGGGVTLAVEAQSVSALSYQWKFNGVAIEGATSATLELDTLLAGEGGSYTVDVMNANDTVTSAPAAITLFEDPISTSLVTHLEFEDDLLDTSGNGLNGTAMGDVPFADGVIGRAISVSTDADATSFNYVTLGAPAALNFGTDVDFTVSFWANLVDFGGDPALIANKDWDSGNTIGWLVATAGDRRAQWNIAGKADGTTGDRKDFDSAGGVFTAGNWKHIAVVFDRSGTARTYVNGTLVDSRSVASPVNGLNTAAGLATNIGQDGTGAYGSPITEAYIDDVGIWTRRLTDAEVAAIWRGGLTGKNLELVTGKTLGIVSSAEVAGDLLNFDWRGQPGARLQRSINLVDWEDVLNTTGESQISIPIDPELNEYFRLLMPE